ncbi:DUF6057 family protein [Parabacteroides sp. PF5-6]|uniref:DUF6057 family protein n=1 Tax=Parabacteroides sp. PF5-6 TaxID=1742403 RepID=UPI002405C1F5|nr:DUF6057 family protein [Parabacteroides sp. PF5-6]MDF9829234.1 hypothetical protein [Parabacteroides sp. PF5-6]
MEKITYSLSVVLWATLLFLLNYTNSYLFFTLEQNQLLVYSWPYFLKEIFYQPGGPIQFIGAFVIQFFRFPYMGEAFTSLFLAATWLLTVFIGRRIAPKAILYILAFVPVFFLLLLHLDFNYNYTGTLSFVLTLAFFLGYTGITRYAIRTLAGAITIPVLYWAIGPVSCFFAFYILIWEILHRTPKSYRSFLVWIESLGLAAVGFYLLWTPNFNNVFFYSGIEALPIRFYLPWISFALFLPVVWLLRRWTPKKRYVIALHTGLQMACIVLLAWQGIFKTVDLNSLYLMKYDFHTQHQQWHRIVSTSKGPQNSYFRLCYLNLALAEEGVLAEQGFRFDQKGIQGLVTQWNGEVVSSALLSDIYFAQGNIGMAQAMAFESNINSMFGGKPRMLQRLVQTNLIYGAWPIAEKYLNVLEKTLYYKDWAKEQKRFLYNDAAVEADPLLGEKRKNLIPDNHLSGPWDPRIDLQAIAAHHPQNKVAVEYLGMAHLLSKNLTAFKEFLKEYYPPHSALPAAFQEAFLLCYEEEPERWSDYALSPPLLERFKSYNDFLEKNHTNTSFPQMAYRSYGDTYWYYNMFKM